MKLILNKITYLFVVLFFLAACDGGSDSGGGVEDSTPGDSIPDNFIGTYTGTLDLEASAIGITERDSFAITITVMADGMIRFDGDDPEETFTVGIENSGEFSGNLPVDQDDCVGTVAVTGQVDGTTASGSLEGEGECKLSGLDVDVELSGQFNATKS